MRRIKLSEIKISPSFAETIPNEEKMEECRFNWKTYGRQDRYIVVNNKGCLVDGYIQYLVLKEYNEVYAEVKFSNYKNKRWRRKNTKNWTIPRYKNEVTTYVYGFHLNSNCRKERVWYVPNDWTNFVGNIRVGDKILCVTKFGYSPVIVTKIETLGKPPIEIPIKKIGSKKIWRNGELVEY